MAKQLAVLPPGYRVLRTCQLSRHLSPDRWPLMGGWPSIPAKKAARPSLCRKVWGWGKGRGDERRRELTHCWIRSLKSLPFQDEDAPQAVTGQGRAG